MTSHPAPPVGPDPESIAFGQRLQLLRTGRGMSRPVLAGLMGRSTSWLKQIERGELRTPRLPVILRFAEVLRVRDLSELTGDQRLPVALFSGPGHTALESVRSAIDAFPLDEGPAPSPAHLRLRLDRAWAARHSAPDHRTVVGALLPDLIRDARAAVRQVEEPAERRAAEAVLSEVYALAQFFLAYQGDGSLLWRVAERGMVAAQESNDPHTVAVAAWLLAEAHRDSGHAHLDAAEEITRGALEYLEPLLPDASEKEVSMAGALYAASGYTAARRGDAGTAWGHWDRAEGIARRLPASHYHPITSFGRAVMGAHAVTIAVELHAAGEAVRQAGRTDGAALPSRPRRARHRIEEARAHHLDGRADTALAVLERAHENAPETVRYNGYARRILLEESESRRPALRRRAAALAVRVGVLTA
ncbi:helix-turn-helix domain-containing protein [Streptomyces alkaliphilus]|uniref:Helix-turn-helix domain-containing protein n=1 Tax=Streptomyces alkaliphilus TaxID=1472722 RepID=A0A7W3Y081_9ACTN|nr:helix-turn-helix domain-containing protein [Streptomyces alkaliphilus]MBB0242980.1 helix-turn-helix domain-containing protein [Streptomyces alkaliphilus]